MQKLAALVTALALGLPPVAAAGNDREAFYSALAQQEARLALGAGDQRHIHRGAAQPAFGQQPRPDRRQVVGDPPAQLRSEAHAYSPRQFGLRFWAKAVAPSRASSEVKTWAM